MPDDSTKSDPASERPSRLSLLRSQIAQPAPGTTSEAPPAPEQKQAPAEISQRPGPAVTPSSPTTPGAAWKGLGQPSSHDRRSPVPFEVRYHKDNVMVDKRLLAAYLDLLSKLGRSKAEAFNAMLLQVLLDAGYQLDPKVLDRPFQWEDLPR